MTGGPAEPTQGAELGRKLVHVAASLLAAAVVWILDPLAAATVLAGATAVALIVELFRRVSPRFRRGFQQRLAPLLRPRETHRLTGATTLALGYTLAAVIFPGTPALLGILLTGVADAVAAVVGKRYGRLRYPGGKSVEGSAAFLAVSLALVWVVADPGFGPALAVSLLVTLLEAPSLPVDDNLYLPVAAAGSAWAIATLVLPQGFS